MVLASLALTVSGCMTTAERARENRTGPSMARIGEAVKVARLQSPAANIAEGNVSPSQLVPPPLPDPSLPSTVPDTGLSSIARNRRANRGIAAPSPSDGAPAGAAAGPLTSSPVDRQLGGLSPIFRNRLLGSVGAGEEPQFNYPDIHDDPARRYHDRYGVEEEHDPFLFPWLMNLIFEDRWLLADTDPATALQNQLRRRMKIDIRDPDPDTANFPNGA
jgi:hypothetical protein